VSALDQFMCRWGRDVYPDQDPCPTVANNLVVLHDPDDMTLASIPVKLCDKHVNAISEESTPTSPDRVKEWAARYDPEGTMEHAPGHPV
jgi:hypothetical protein